jgi:hypothetical protein
MVPAMSAATIRSDVERERPRAPMTDPKNPVELFRESLRANAEEVRQWPQWMREALSTARVFGTAQPSGAPRPERKPERDR